MQITIEIWAGPGTSKHPTKKDIQKNIDALRKLNSLGKNKITHIEHQLNLDTISILEGIRYELPEV